MVNLWKEKFDTRENKEDLDVIISSVNKLILIYRNTLLKMELIIEDSSTKINADHMKSNMPNKRQPKQQQKIKKKKNYTKKAGNILSLFRWYPKRAMRNILGARN